MVCVMAPDHPLSLKASVTPADLARHPFIGLERGTRLGEALRDAFARAGVPFDATVEVRYCNTACVLAGAGVGVAVVDPFSPSQGGAHPVVVRPFEPRTPVEAFMLWSEAEPLSRLARAFLAEVRATRASP
jgi:DNA-binding transcriptional LysR family regulator